MKKLIILGSLLFVLGGLTMIVGADDQQIINITLEPQSNLEIECNQSSWAPSAGLGSLREATTATWGNVTNVGDVTCKVTATALDTEDWSLVNESGHATAEGHDVIVLEITGTYAHIFENNIAWNCDQELEPVGDGGNPEFTFGLAVHMPTTSSTPDDQHTTITFEATAL